jgi:nucleoid-associated protein YgaU
MAQVKITHHTVQPGETLMELARRYHGDSAKYRDIFFANAAVFVGSDREMSADINPDTIYPGDRLVIVREAEFEPSGN